jgi:hypothetical protein
MTTFTLVESRVLTALLEYYENTVTVTAKTSVSTSDVAELKTALKTQITNDDLKGILACVKAVSGNKHATTAFNREVA